MGCRSDVRIRLTKKDYERLASSFKNQSRNSPLDFSDEMFGAGLDVYKVLNNVDLWKVTDDGEDIEESVDCIFFGWNYVKWYYNYKDVKFIMDFIKDCDHYAFCRIGESIDGDVECHEKNMDMIGYYCQFEEDLR